MKLPMCLLFEKTFRIDAKKPDTMRDHLERIHSHRKNKDGEYFKMLKEKVKALPNMNAFLHHMFVLMVKEY